MQCKVRCSEVRWSDCEVMWGEVRWCKVKWGNVRWGKVKWGEVRWSEVMWGEVRWCKVKWGNVRWGEVRWSEVRWSEVRWGKVKWGVKLYTFQDLWPVAKNVTLRSSLTDACSQLHPQKLFFLNSVVFETVRQCYGRTPLRERNRARKKRDKTLRFNARFITNSD